MDKMEQKAQVKTSRKQPGAWKAKKFEKSGVTVRKEKIITNLKTLGLTEEHEFVKMRNSKLID